MVDNLEHKFRSEPSLKLSIYRYCFVKEEVLGNTGLEKCVTWIVNLSGWRDWFAVWK